MNRSRRIGLVAAAALCLALAPAAGAERLGWKETAKVAGAPVMSYRVESLTFGAKTWSARISMRNLSHKSIKVGKTFGIAFWNNGKSEKLSQVVGYGKASTYSKKLPAVLKPGASWSAVITGQGTVDPTRKLYARLVFGPFSPFPGRSGPVVWITDHVKAVGKAASEPPAAGPVI